MIDIDEFERAMRSALEADAARAPSRHVPWTGTVLRDARSTPHRAGRLAAMGVVAAAVVAAFIAVGMRHAERSLPAAFQPAGNEFPIADLGPATRRLTPGPTLTELSRDIGINGTSQLTVQVGLEYQGGESPVQVRCIGGDDGSALCAPEYVETWINIYRTATTEGDTGPRWWALESLPAGTAYVSYVDGKLSLWQRPIDGVAVFPDVNGEFDGHIEVAVAYSIDGVELGRVDPATRAASDAAQANTNVRIAELDSSQESSLKNLTDTSLKSCLVDAGASFDGTAGTVPAGTDAQAVWDHCIATTKAIVTSRLAQLNVNYHDSNAAASGGDGVPTTEDAAGPQDQALSDGHVTLQEYQNAFNEFEECANKSTETVIHVETDPSSGLITYGIRSDLGQATTDANACLQKYFASVERVWQATDPGFLAASRQQAIDDYNQDLRPCLELNGITVPEQDPEPGTQEYGALVTAAAGLINAGKCPNLNSGQVPPPVTQTYPTSG